MAKPENNTYKIASYSMINMVGQGIRVFLSFLATVFVSRWLGAKGFGEINLILGYTVYLGYFLSFGFEVSLPYFNSTRLEKSDETIESVFLVGIFNTLAGGIIILPIIYYLLPKLLSVNCLDYLFIPASILSVQTLIISLGSVISGYLRGVKYFLPSIIREQFSFGILHFIGVIFFIGVLGWNVTGYAISYSLATVAGFLIVLTAAVRYYKKNRKRAFINITTGKWISWSSFSFPLGLMNTLEPILNWSSIIIIGYLLTPVEVGQFSISARLTFFIQFAFVSLQPIFSPFIADLFKIGLKDKSEELLNVVCYWSAKWSVFFSFFLIHGSPYILSFFGNSYSPAESCMLILVPGFLFEGIFGPLKQTLIMAGHSKINVFNFVLSILLNIVLSCLLIPRMGIEGGALSFSLTYIGLNTLRIIQVYHYFKILPFNGRQTRQLLLIVVGLTMLSLIRIIMMDALFCFIFATAVFAIGLIISFWKDMGLFIYWTKKRGKPIAQG